MPKLLPDTEKIKPVISLREFIIECRKRTPQILEVLDDILDNPAIEPNYKLVASQLYLSYGYGKPKQNVDHTIDRSQSPVQVYIPRNARESDGWQPYPRDNLPAPIIDQTGQEQSDLPE